MFLRARASGLTHPASAVGVGDHVGEGGGEVVHEFLGVQGCAGAVGDLFDGHEAPGLAVDHDFGDAAGSGGDHGGTAGHGLEIDDAQGFVDGGARECGGVGQDLDDGAAGQHLLDEHDAVAFVLELVDEDVDLGAEFGGVRGAGAQHELHLGRQLQGGAQEVGHAFLAGHAAHEDHGGFGGVDAVLVQDVGVLVAVPLADVDPVVHGAHALGVHIGVGGEDVAAHAVGHGDDRGGGLVGGLLREAGHPVPAAELFGLPRAQGFQGVGGEHVGDVVHEGGQVSAHVGVPRVGVHQIRALNVPDHGEVHPEGLHGGVGVGQFTRHGVGLHTGAVEVRVPGFAEAADVEVHERCEHAGQLGHVHPRSPVDGRRELFAQDVYSHTASVLHGGARTQVCKSS